jgi:hypothetical protein
VNQIGSLLFYLIFEKYYDIVKVEEFLEKFAISVTFAIYFLSIRVKCFNAFERGKLYGR